MNWERVAKASSISNEILIQWGWSYHPQVTQNSEQSVTVNLPTSYTSLDYSVAIAMSNDAGATHFLRQTKYRKTNTQITFTWYSTQATLQSAYGAFSWITIGY